MDWATAVELYLLEHEANGRSGRTVDWHKHTLDKFAAWAMDQGLKGPDALTPAHLTRWLAWLRTRPSARGGTLKEGAVWSYACSVRAFLAWAVDQDLLVQNPARKVKVKQAKPLPKPFTDQELAALWRAVARLAGTKGARYRAMLAFLIDTGVRAGELCSLDPQDLVWDQRLAMVTGKTGPRPVAFGPRTALLLRRYAALRDQGCPAFFQTHLRQRWTPNAVLHWVHRLADQAGVEDAHPHRFRATWATTAAQTGNLFAVQAQLGHTTLDMTRRYAAVSGQDLLKVQAQVAIMDKVTKGRA